MYYTLILNQNGKHEAITGLPLDLTEARKKAPQILTDEEKSREGVWEIWRDYWNDNKRFIEEIEVKK